MRQCKLFMMLVLFIFIANGLQAQRLANYTVAEQAQLDSIVQTYLNKGIPEKSAMNRAQTVFESNRKIATRSESRNPTPALGSVWIDRDALGTAFSKYHDYTPERFVKEVFIKDADKIGSAIDDVIQNVKFYGTGWNHTTEQWETTKIDTVNQTSADDRALHYFDHGDITSTVERCWDGTCNQVPRFGIENGFLLATGPALTTEGLNEYKDFSGNVLSGGNPVPTTGAEELKAIATGSGNLLDTYTALEFDFIPYVDSVSFQYIFASTEFKNYSNSEFNDAFGFFVTGEDLKDEWGNTGPTINIACYPSGDPIAVNASNWGYRYAPELADPDIANNYYFDYDPLGPTPAKTSGMGIDPSTNCDSTAIYPQYHVPVYASGKTKRNGVISYENCDTSSMHYNGHSIVLTAKVKLTKGKKYHMKLAIGNVSDKQLGSGTFLMGGSFDLGAPELDVLRPYATTPYDTIYGWNSLYTNCPSSITLSVPTSGSAQDISVWSEGTGADFVYDTKLNKYFKDSIKYTIPANDSVLTIKFSVDDQVKNGSQVAFHSELKKSGGKDTTEVFDLFAKSTTELNHFYFPSPNYAGKLDITSTNGSSYIQRSLNGGITWQFAYDTITGKMTPFTQTQIANLAEDKDAYILFREPNTCCAFDTLFVHDAIIPPVILREIKMPIITGAICDKVPGQHFVNSRDDFSFTITPTANNAGRVLKITTSRTSIPDSEGVVIKKNEDGTYTVTIKHIQEPIDIYVDFATSNDAVDNNKVWTNGNKLHIRTTSAQEAAIYTISGSLVSTVNLTGKGTTSISLSKGFYIVKIDNVSYKVVVK